jgi:endonuclease YncB( thermonuclease family)
MARRYRISKTVCKQCGGLISWDAYPSLKWPIHVDSSGYKLGNGSCPNFGKNIVYTELNTSTANKTHLKKPRHKTTHKTKININPKVAIPLLGILALVIVLVPIGITSVMRSGYTPNPPTPPDPPEDPPDPPPTPPQFYWEIDSQGVVTNVVDGDTYDLSSIGRVRLADIDCPDQGEAGCAAATSYMTSLIDGKQVYVDIDDVYQTDVYGRYVCVTYVRYNSTHLLNVNKDLLVQGYASIWNFDNEFNPYEWPLYVYYV